jgi:hypothetical protein
MRPREGDGGSPNRLREAGFRKAFLLKGAQLPGCGALPAVLSLALLSPRTGRTAANASAGRSAFLWKACATACLTVGGT